MQIFKKTPNYDFMGQAKLYLILSGSAVLLSILAIIFIGPRFGIDFVGGTELQVAFQTPATSGEIRQTLAELGFPASEVVSFGARDSEYLIRMRSISPVSDALMKSSEAAFKASMVGANVSRFEFSPGGDKLTIRLSKETPIADVEGAVAAAGLTLGFRAAPVKESAAASNPEEEQAAEETDKNCAGVTCTWSFQNTWIYEVSLKGVSDRVMEGLRAEPFGVGAVKMRSEWVGPKVGAQLTWNAIASILYSLVFIMIYIVLRFDFRYAPGGVVALIHDVVITAGIVTVTRVEFNLATVAALLTIVGYSINDTIVTFDRVRENIGKTKDKKLWSLINLSVNETLSRTILTSVTVFLSVMSILIIGWNTTIRDFAFALAIGTIVGCYSTVFIASPILLWFNNKFDKKRA